jgi:hypothetical protein
MGERGNPLRRVNHEMRDDHILNVITIHKFPKHGKRHRYLRSEPQAGVASNGRPKLALRNRRPLNYALTRGHGVNEISKMIEELIHNGKNSRKLGTQIARYERGMFIFSRESG